jgi:hypothetical protein
MNDDEPHVDGAGDMLTPDIIALLADHETWAPAPDVADSIVALIRSEATTPPVAIAAARARRAATVPRWLKAVAAVVAIAVAGSVVARLAGDDTPTGVASAASDLTATDLAPGASATATFAATPAGLKIILDVDGLPGAGRDEMYEAWVSDGTIRVSAGTFHLRGGDAPIELWAGVADPRFHIITVSLEPVDGVAESSGQTVLRGEYSLPGD